MKSSTNLELLLDQMPVVTKFKEQTLVMQFETKTFRAEKSLSSNNLDLHCMKQNRQTKW